eukprot:GEMP01053517.1.p2 GENE.GEMP01053517.1~~GEMP01053517.1.p2  ORF type:complete len:109 (-),score=14.62 GEMP01053517.1:214-540(-)
MKSHACNDTCVCADPFFVLPYFKESYFLAPKKGGVAQVCANKKTGTSMLFDAAMGNIYQTPSERLYRVVRRELPDGLRSITGTTKKLMSKGVTDHATKIVCVTPCFKG